LSEHKKPVAWVTGAGSGIGLAISKELKSRGFKVEEITRSDFDLSNTAAIKDWVRNREETPFLIVCNAGINLPMKISEENLDKYEEIIKSNYYGHLQLCLSVLPNLVRNGGGRIVFISSAYSQRARAGRFAYSVSKSSLDSLMRSIALEYGASGVLANSVSPGFIETELTLQNNSDEAIAKILERVPLDRLGTTSEVASLVGFLGSRENTYITGQVINIDGGFSIS
jgi:NAD(P)-dependent dehydrogenase (short-subunit alcohol dehydrogenase family)